jgi:hypothetical protein
MTLSVVSIYCPPNTKGTACAASELRRPAFGLGVSLQSCCAHEAWYSQVIAAVTSSAA